MHTDNPDHLRFMPGNAGENSPEAENRPTETETAVKSQAITEVVIEEIVSEKITVKENSMDHGDKNKDFGPMEYRLESGMKLFYRIFSPFMVPTYATLFIFLLSILSIVAPGAATAYTLTVFGATGLVPIILLLIMRKLGMVDSFEIHGQSERQIPYIVQFLVLGAMTLFFLYKGANSWIWTIYLGATAVSLVNFVINYKIRVSNHCSAVAALLAVLMVIQRSGMPPHSLFWWVVGALIVTGIVGAAAISIGRHKLIDVIVGYATGFLGVILFSLIH